MMSFLSPTDLWRTALIIPETQVATPREQHLPVLSESYRGRPAAELKYNKISRACTPRARRLARRESCWPMCPALVCLPCSFTGWMLAKKRSIAAVSHYDGTHPSPAELLRVDSPTVCRGRCAGTCRTR